MKPRHLSFLVSVFVFFIVSISVQSAEPLPTTQSAYFPSDDWRVSTPEAQGMDSSVLAAMFTEIAAKHYDIHSIMVIRHGYVVMSAHSEPFSPTVKHTLNSASKSFVSALVGIALAEGHIKSLDQKMVDFFPGLISQNLDGAKSAITIQNLLTISSGIAMDNGENAGDNKSRAYLTNKNRVSHYLNLPMAAAPGKIFNYDNGGVDMLAQIIHRATGLSLAEYAKQKLLNPIGIRDFHWELDPQGSDMGYRELALSASDMAKFGCLYLHHGYWNGQQVIPSDFVTQSLSSKISTSQMMGSLNYGYGYLWWETRIGGFLAGGYGGQFIVVNPNLDLVVVFTSDLAADNGWKPIELANHNIYPAIKRKDSPLAENQADQQKPALAIQEFQASSRINAQAKPELADKISGKLFKFDSDRYPWKSLTIKFGIPDKDACQIEIRGDGAAESNFSLASSSNGQYRAQKTSPDQDILSRGYWTNDSTFMVDYYDQNSRENKKSLIFQFADENTISLMTVGKAGEPVRILTGTRQR